MEIKTKKKYIKGRLYEISECNYIGNVIPKGREKDIDICIWSEDESYKWTIATLHWNEKEPCYELVSFGMRLAEYGNTKLLKWLLKIAQHYERVVIGITD